MIGNEPRNRCDKPLPAKAGIMMKMALKITTAIPSVQLMTRLDTWSSSGICRFADHVSAR